MISAGIPAWFSFSRDATSATNAVNIMFNFCQTHFNDNVYANYSKSVSCDYSNDDNLLNGDFKGIDRESNLVKLGELYWIGTPSGKWDTEPKDLRCIYEDGIGRSLTSGIYGIRPIVVLKTGVKTREKQTENFLGQTCWKLM